MDTRSRKKVEKRVFVTVGTTQFEKLIQAVCTENTLQCLKMLGYTHVLLQIGNGEFEPQERKGELTVEYYRYKPSIREDIEVADFVISHAGAGSCLETLDAGKKLLVVINDELMGNHQLELAYQLEKDGHLHYCTPSTIVEALKTKDFDNLVPFPPGQPQKFADFLDKVMGFT